MCLGVGEGTAKQESAKISEFVRRQGPFVDGIENARIKSKLPESVQRQSVREPRIAQMHLERLSEKVVDDVKVQRRRPSIDRIVKIEDPLVVGTDAKQYAYRETPERAQGVDKLLVYFGGVFSPVIGRKPLRGDDDGDGLSAGNELRRYGGNVAAQRRQLVTQGSGPEGMRARHDGGGDVDFMCETGRPAFPDAEILRTNVGARSIEQLLFVERARWGGEAVSGEPRELRGIV